MDSRSCVAFAGGGSFEQLHRSEQRFSHVLLVAGATGASQQVIDDGPFMFKGTFSVMSSATVTYVLIESSTSQVVASGHQVGTDHLRGKVGDTFELDSK